MSSGSIERSEERTVANRQHRVSSGSIEPGKRARPASERTVATGGAAEAVVLRRRLPLPVLLGLMLVGGLCALLALNTASAAQELKLRGVTDQTAAQSDAEQQLLRDLAAKQAPAALASAATALGLVPNPNPAFLRINADGSVTVLGSPTPASSPPPPPKPKPTPTKPSSTKPTTKPSASPTGTAKPSGSAKPTTSSSRPAPQVTVTVTRPASTTSTSRGH